MAAPPPTIAAGLPDVAAVPYADRSPPAVPDPPGASPKADPDAPTPETPDADASDPAEPAAGPEEPLEAAPPPAAPPPAESPAVVDDPVAAVVVPGCPVPLVPVVEDPGDVVWVVAAEVVDELVVPWVEDVVDGPDGGAREGVRPAPNASPMAVPGAGSRLAAPRVA